MADLYTNGELLAQAIRDLSEKAGGIGGSGASGCLALFTDSTSLAAGPSIDIEENVGKYLTGDGTWQAFPTAKNGTLGFVKTTSSVSNTTGYTPCPIIGGVVYYRSATATTSAAGFMSPADKSKLVELESRIAYLEDLNGCSV